jgi:hypothetical protein
MPRKDEIVGFGEVGWDILRAVFVWNDSKGNELGLVNFTAVSGKGFFLYSEQRK